MPNLSLWLHVTALDEPQEIFDLIGSPVLVPVFRCTRADGPFWPVHLLPTLLTSPLMRLFHLEGIGRKQYAIWDTLFGTMSQRIESTPDTLTGLAQP